METHLARRQNSRYKNQISLLYDGIQTVVLNLSPLVNRGQIEMAPPILTGERRYTDY